MPVCYVIAGPNGAGKTSFATAFLPHYVGAIPFVNPDLIAQGLSPFDARSVAAKAGRLVIERIQELLTQRLDFAFESTLSGRAYLHLFRRLRSAGYRIRLIYLWIPTPELALARITTRVRRGGHDVPEQDVRRRMPRSLANLYSAYRPLSHSLWLLDNSGNGTRVVAVHVGSRTRVFDAALFQAILPLR